jgi:hypothetical protein
MPPGAPRQNRVTPTGEIEATPARGLLTGNRGVLHDARQRLGVARWRHPHWIACALAYKDWRRPIMAPGRWTELFFLDEAVALAAGHRPCALCRRADFQRFLRAWEAAFGARARAPEIDAILHRARVEPRLRRQVTHRAALESLPDGTFVRLGEAPWLVLGERLLRWTHAGYDNAVARGEGDIEVLTPAPLVAVLAAGYRPLLHPGAAAPADRPPGAGGRRATPQPRAGGSRPSPRSASAAR